MVLYQFLSRQKWRIRIKAWWTYILEETRCYSRRRQWHPTPVLLPGKSHGRRSLVGCSPCSRWSQTQLSDFNFTFHFHALEKEKMATHSSVLAWRIPGMGEPNGLPSMGSHRVRHDCSDLAAERDNKVRWEFPQFRWGIMVANTKVVAVRMKKADILRFERCFRCENQ